MSGSTGLIATSFVGVFVIVGCSEVGTATTAPVTVTVSDPELKIRLEGVEVCEADTRRCVITDAAGQAQLDFPRGAEHSLAATKEGYASYLVPNVLVLENWWGLNVRVDMVSADEVARQHGRIGAPYPMQNTGTVTVRLEQQFAGATFELVGATGTPFYSDEEGRWSPELSATTAWAEGGFAEVGHGEFQVNVGGTAWRCIAFNAWPGDDDDSVRFPVRVGFITMASVRCAERPAN
jgi:hypothetical protein